MSPPDEVRGSVSCLGESPTKWLIPTAKAAVMAAKGSTAAFHVKGFLRLISPPGKSAPLSKYTPRRAVFQGCGAFIFLYT
jgi:hypothetical protein